MWWVLFFGFLINFPIRLLLIPLLHLFLMRVFHLFHTQLKLYQTYLPAASKFNYRKVEGVPASYFASPWLDFGLFISFVVISTASVSYTRYWLYASLLYFASCFYLLTILSPCYAHPLHSANTKSMQTYELQLYALQMIRVYALIRTLSLPT